MCVTLQLVAAESKKKMSKSKQNVAASSSEKAVSKEVQMSPRPIVMPDQYTGEEDWMDWIVHFELCARINDWDDEAKTDFLAVRLTKTAQQVYRDLPSSSKNSYDDLKAAMATRFAVTNHAELHKAELRFVRRGRNEKLTELANRIRHLGCVAYPTVDVQFRDELCRDQFLDALEDREFRLRQLRPKSLDEAVTLASEIEVMEQAEDRKQTKVIRATDVPAAEVSAINNEQTNRVLERSLQVIEQNTAVMKEMLSAMRINGSAGYRGEYNESKQNRKSRNGSACYNCGKIGHFIASCPEIRGNDGRLR